VEAHNLSAALNSLKAADILLLVWPANGDISEEQELFLSTIMAYGVPTTMHAVTGLPVNGKKRDQLRKALQSSMEKWYMLIQAAL